MEREDNNLEKDKKELIRTCQCNFALIKKLYNYALIESYTSCLREEYAKLIAVKLKALLISTKNDDSLFSKIGIDKKFLFEPVCCKSSTLPTNLLKSYELISFKTDNGDFICCSKDYCNKSDLRCTLDVWLNEIVIDQKSAISPKVSRKDVILTLRDKEGGAHVDSSYTQQYYDTVFNSGFEIIENGVTKKIKNNFFVETLLSITCEFINSINEHDIIAKKYFYKVDNDLSLVELAYLDRDNIIRYKYIHNQSKDIKNIVAVAWDYMAICRYRIIFTTNVIFEDNSSRVGFRIIDNTIYNDIFFVTGHNNVLFVKNRNRFCMINEDKDLYKLDSCRKYTFSQVLKMIKSMNRQDQIEKQKLYIDYMENKN